MPIKVVVIDDEQQFTDMLSEFIAAAGYVTNSYTDAREFFKAGADGDVLIVDLNMPRMDGVEVIRLLGERRCDASLILMSGYDTGVLRSAEKLAQEHDLNIIASLTKPVQLSEFTRLLSELQRRKTQNDAAKQYNYPPINVEELRHAIHNDELVLYYQPQINLMDNSMSGVEALVRWQHPQRGLVGPASFIPMAESQGLISDLTSLVIQLAVKQNIEWQKQGVQIPVSINVSAENITSLVLPEQLTSLANENRVDPSLFVLEITESALMGELVTYLDILTRLRMKGFELSIDDFGTGYSSLSHLHRVPFTELKIDQSFVMSIDKDEDACSIVETCVMLGHKLKMSVVAEGVETPAVLALLKDMGCDYAQGYYFAKPMPAEELLSWQASR